MLTYRNEVNMKNTGVKNIIMTFFGKKMSKNTQLLFMRWFRMPENQEEKDAILSDIWEQSESIVTEKTIEDLNKLKKQLFTERKKAIYLRQLIRYAAAITLIISISSFFTYLIISSETVEYQQLSVAYGENKKINLADGTVVAVNAGSTLIYPTKFSGKTRTVFLSGEAIFDVATNKRKPFTVRTKHIDITALGTKFSVQSYPNSDYSKTTLIEGRVKVVVENENSNPYILTPDHQLSYSHSNKNISITEIDARKTESWEKGYLIFQDISFEEIIKTIERKYNVDINYDSRRLQKQSYYIKFNPDETIKDVMDVLCLLINGSSYKIDGSTIYFYYNNP